ncbi:arsenite efflux transporter metallochaperone ArsD [Raineyella sp. LH-20]|uniref:arsenite efflux transporter metallochaperone ArsD n=1 Tax=Raineyella sp. LH-20 TaxID=3081204 RepID=UPI0029544BB4|nr:arsenite efflux transporter metallochaperone ArsD [Raineyella sp. LH-20]WOP19726.1 arsenite efflux transporter metallochaperone ArsD [Raineyella sp. LH-20]
MVALKVFEGPLCCNTGVCGPDPEQALVDFTADARWLATQGVEVTRANLAQDPAAFAEDPSARAFVRVAGAEALPLVVVDGITVLTGRYPSRAELARFAGLAAPASAPAAATESSCCGADDQASGCCSPAPQVLQISAPTRSCC